jgi:hypothetical protein
VSQAGLGCVSFTSPVAGCGIESALALNGDLHRNAFEADALQIAC